MNILQITPGAGAMFCGNCLRDNALVAALRRQGHRVLMLPMYLPLTLDEPSQCDGVPIFFGGVNVFLEQKSPLFARMPGWLHRWLASPGFLRRASGRTVQTRPAAAGDIMLSMLEGENGRQARELEELTSWLATQERPEVISLSNALLLGLAPQLKRELGAPLVCTLEGETSFVDGLPETHRDRCWKALSERAKSADLFIAPSRYFRDVMARRLGLNPALVKIVPNGINLEGYATANAQPAQRSNTAPILGFFARMCHDKGLHTLVEAFIEIRRRRKVTHLRLHVGGSCGAPEQPLVRKLREDLERAGLTRDVEFFPNLNRTAKLEFLRSLSVFSVPATYGEAFGLYLLEAMAAGVPVVQPETAAFPELLQATGGGTLCAPSDVSALTAAIEELILDPDRARQLGQAGKRAVFGQFSAEHMAAEITNVLSEILKPGSAEKAPHHAPATT